MADSSQRARLTFVWTVSPTPMSAESYSTVQELLAEFIARAYRADHPELFKRKTPGARPKGAETCETGSAAGDLSPTERQGEGRNGPAEPSEGGRE